MENNMKKILAAATVGALLALPAGAASRQVQDAIKTFEQVAGDPAKLKTFCELDATMASAADEQDESKEEALEKQVEGYVKSLGADFEKALELGSDLDPESEDEKTYEDALDKLVEQCS